MSFTMDHSTVLIHFLYNDNSTPLQARCPEPQSPSQSDRKSGSQLRSKPGARRGTGNRSL